MSSLVTRTALRSLARLAQHGAAPEVLSWQALRAVTRTNEAYIAMLDAASLSPRHCLSVFLQACKTGAERECKVEIDPFVVMRNTAGLAHALRPRALPSWLPALLDDCSFLPGERCQFIARSPEHYAIFEDAMVSSDQRFVHITKRPGLSPHPEHIEAASTTENAIGTVMTVMSSSTMPFGSLAIECVAGPRCRIIDRQLMPILSEHGDSDGLPLSAKRMVRVAPELCWDTKAPDESMTRALHRELAAVMLRPQSAPVLSCVEVVPPLHCAERFSFFVCSLLLHGDDTDRRLASLYMNSSAERLQHCIHMIQAGEWAALVASTAGESKGADAGQAVSRPWERTFREPARMSSEGAQIRTPSSLNTRRPDAI